MEAGFGHRFGNVQVSAPARPSLQARFRVSRVGDSDERAADDAAHAVTHSPQFRRQGSRSNATTKQARKDSASRADFGAVRVHTGPAANAAADSVAARAFTVGNHIVFADGQYAPHSSGGRELLAHELAHTVQQSPGAPTIRRKSWGGCPKGKRIDPRGFIKGGLKGSLKGVATSLKVYTYAEVAAVNYYKFHPANSGHCVMTNHELAEGETPANCNARDTKIAKRLIKHFHRDNKAWGKRQDVRSADDVTERVEGMGGAVSEGLSVIANLQPDILDITQGEVYDVTTSKMAGKKTLKVFLSYVRRLDAITGGRPWKAGARHQLAPGPMGGIIKSGDISICFRDTNFARTPGVIEYTAFDESKKKGDKKKGKKSGKKKEPKKKRPKKGGKKGAPKGGKAKLKMPKFGNVGFGIGILSSGGGAANASVGVSIMSNGQSYGTVSAGIVYDSDGVAVGTASAGLAASSSSNAAASAALGAAEQADTNTLAGASAGQNKGGAGTQIGTATKGKGGGDAGVQVGKTGAAKEEQEEGAGESDQEGDEEAAGGGEGSGGGKGETAGGGKGEAGEGGEGGPQKAGGQKGGGAGAGKGDRAAKPLLNVPGVQAAEEQKAINEAAIIDAKLQKISPQRRAFLDWLASKEEDSQYAVPEADWVERMLTATEGLKDKDFEKLQKQNWQPGNVEPDELKKSLQQALKQDEPAEGKPADQPSPQDPQQEPKQKAPDEKKKKQRYIAPKKPLKPSTEPKETTEQLRKRLLERGRAFKDWDELAKDPGNVLYLVDTSKLDEPQTITMYLSGTVGGKGTRVVNMTADGLATLSKKGKTYTLTVHSHTEFISTNDRLYELDFVGTHKVWNTAEGK